MNDYVVATAKSWNHKLFAQRHAEWPGRWTLVREPDELTAALIERLKPRYIFFPHWSHIVPAKILDLAECVCFHMTDVPYGRGGSPLQNLIVRGHDETMLTALRMTREIDAGPVYRKVPLSLGGTANDILRRAAAASFDTIGWIVANEPRPSPQEGAVVRFERRKPGDGDLAPVTTLKGVHDHIRMLDGEGYPPAFLQTAGHRYEFTEAELDSATGEVRARVVVRTRGSD